MSIIMFPDETINVEFYKKYKLLHFVKGLDTNANKLYKHPSI